MNDFIDSINQRESLNLPKGKYNAKTGLISFTTVKEASEFADKISQKHGIYVEYELSDPLNLRIPPQDLEKLDQLTNGEEKLNTKYNGAYKKLSEAKFNLVSYWDNKSNKDFDQKTEKYEKVKNHLDKSIFEAIDKIEKSDLSAADKTKFVNKFVEKASNIVVEHMSSDRSNSIFADHSTKNILSQLDKLNKKLDKAIDTNNPEKSAKSLRSSLGASEERASNNHAPSNTKAIAQNTSKSNERG